MAPPIWLIHARPPHACIFSLCVLRTLKFFCLSRFHLENTVLSVQALHASRIDPYSSYGWKSVPWDHPLPNSHAHPQATCLLSVSMSLASFFFFNIPHIKEIVQYSAFSVWFISLSIIPSRSVHVVAESRISFSIVANIPPYVYMCMCLLVQLSHSVVTPWAAAHQTSLSITNYRSLLRLMSIELVMPSNHLIFCRPLLLLPSTFPGIRVFSSESALHSYTTPSLSVYPSMDTDIVCISWLP